MEKRKVISYIPSENIKYEIVFPKSVTWLEMINRVKKDIESYEQDLIAINVVD